jgi:putative phosphoribosyl transferase
LKLYQDRADAGRRLAALLTEYADRPDVIVLALPRGGVPVGFEVARVLHAMLDVFLVRKLGLPGYEELAMGAIASGGVIVVNEEVVRQFRIAPGTLEGVAEQELQELERREAVYRHGRSFPDISGRTVILVDDGLATGSTMRAGVTALRQLEPAAVIVAVPVGAPDTCELLKHSADRVMCAQAPENFSAVGRWYVDFDQTTDDEVCYLLQQGATEYQQSHTEKEVLARK